MTNLYVFWKNVADPPSPWTRLTRTNQYLRLSNTTSNHWTSTGSSSHNHSISGYSCDNGTVYSLYAYYYNSIMNPHSHGEPSSWTVASSNNLPPSYGLDVIYMDLTSWESGQRKFPSGAVLLSNGALVDSELSRFSSADGKFIVNTTPGTLAGNANHSHSTSGTTQASGTSSNNTGQDNGTLVVPAATSHTHTINLTSTSISMEPRTLVTRLYETLQETSKAVSGTVVFVDGSVTANWEILTSWDGANIKSGDYDPTLSGSDNHTHTISGNTSTASPSLTPRNIGTSSGWGSTATHTHAVSATLASTSLVPSSRYVTAARLLTTMYASAPGARPQLIGLSAW